VLPLSLLLFLIPYPSDLLTLSPIPLSLLLSLPSPNIKLLRPLLPSLDSFRVRRKEEAVVLRGVSSVGVVGRRVEGGESARGVGGRGGKESEFGGEAADGSLGGKETAAGRVGDAEATLVQQENEMRKKREHRGEEDEPATPLP
jgi:hypothetical protein